MHARARPASAGAAITSLSPALADRLVTVSVALFALAYAVFFSFLSLHRHSVYETDAFDLANMEQALWNTTQGRPLDFTNFEGLTNRLGAHVEPMLLFIAPIYALAPRPETILILQSVVIALGALPISWLARELLRSRLAALIFPLAYLLFPALQAANLYDFHAVTLTAALLAFAFWFAHRRNALGYWAAVVLALSCKEDVPLPVFVLGLWVAVGLGWRRVGLATSALAVVWFFVTVQVVIPHFNPEKQSPYLDTRYGHLGTNIAEIAATLVFNPPYWIAYVTQPSKLEYMRDLLTPVAFLSLFAPLVLAVLSPTLLLILLSSSKLQNTLELEHYPAPLVPVVVVSAVYGVAFLARQLAARTSWPFSRWTAVFSIVVLVFTLVYHRDRGSTPLAEDFALKERTARHALADRLLTLVPADAALSATGALNAHLAARRTLYVYPRIDDATWVFVDFAPSIAPVINRDRYEHIEALRRAGFGVVAAEDGFLMLGKGEPDRASVEAAFRRPAPAGWTPRTPVAARLGPVSLVGYTPGYEARATASLTLGLRVERPGGEDIRLFTVLLDEVGRPLPGSEAELVAPIWFPTSRWTPNEIYLVETMRWGRRNDPGAVRVGLIATGGGSPTNPADRLPITVEGGPTLVTARDGVLHLATFHSDGRTIWDASPSRLTALPAGAQPVGAALAEGIRLEGVQLSATRCGSPCFLDVTLYWRTDRRQETSPSVFLHLAGPDGRPAAQSDGIPDEGRRPVSSWLAGELVADRHRIEARVPPGEYRLLTGLYDPRTGQRLTGPAGDSVDLGRVRVGP
ncbi:MAG: DUF2079 domain-containing protein [Chloroflexota bacterium]|nr:DUF2079 domain-containing protein [Dehalococcoidia bacterium]MDW8252543.1 DUF2079 domain-containing protein [Chloroflexota bacterium]